MSNKQDLRKDTAENLERTVLCNRNRIIFFIERYEVGSESVILKFLHICISVKIEDTYFAIIKAGGLFNPDEVLIMVFRLHTVTIYIYTEGCGFRNIRRGNHLIFIAVEERAGTGGNGIVKYFSFPNHVNRNDICWLIVAGAFQISDIFKHLVQALFIQVSEWVQRTLANKICVDIIYFKNLT